MDALLPPKDRATQVCESLLKVNANPVSVEVVLNYFDDALKNEKRPAQKSFVVVAQAAAAKGRADILERLLEVGCQLCPTIYWGAIEGRSIAVFEVLRRRGWNINNQCMPGGFPILGHLWEDPHLANWFFSQGADLNKKNNKGKTPLSIIVQNAPKETISWFLDKGGLVDQGWLLHYALRRGSEQYEVVHLLLKFLTEKQKKDPRDLLNTYELKGYPIDPCERGTARVTPLQEAAGRGDERLVRLLIHMGASSSAPDSEGHTALAYAHGDIRIIQAMQEGDAGVIQAVQQNSRKDSV
ncbi:hypothetical protein BFW01_g293 [Lasiodiplodia theobromae]|uniref:Uncharacterized protein n=1 Tax=Lasiodiplodia theobromae TaxID=45133 RepID=A0A8H7MB73_9PEZI|nr:hypothetical protein BFW01_g293 [Lasiodiplodia theobromae]